MNNPAWDGIGTQPEAPTIADNAYEVIRDACKDDYTRQINHLNLRDAIPFALEDINGLIEASLLAGEWEHTPRLIKQRKRMLVASFGGIPEFESHFALQAEHKMQEVRAVLAQATLNQLKATADYQVADDRTQKAMERDAWPLIPHVVNNNLSQNARSIQTEAWNRVKSAFIQHVTAFAAWMREHDWVYSLRMPIAMIPAIRDDLLSTSPLAGIGMPAAFQTATMNELQTQLFQAGILELIFDDLVGKEDHVTDAIRNRENFLWWDSIASMATARPRGNPMWNVSIIPATLPPWLLYNNPQVPSLYVNRFKLGTYKEDAVTHVDADWSVINGNVDPSLSDFSKPEDWIARNLSLLCLGISLWATQIRLGTGHRIPSWTQTPMNPTTVRWFIDELAALRNEGFPK